MKFMMSVLRVGWYLRAEYGNGGIKYSSLTVKIARPGSAFVASLGVAA